MYTHQWRKAFIELSEAIFRELGFPPPAMIFEDSLPLSMELTLENHPFELVHSENDLSDHIFISCTLGSVPQTSVSHAFRELMKENLLQMRTAGEYFGIDANTQTLRLMFLKSLAITSAPALLGEMRNIVGKWSSWEQKYFSGEVVFLEDGAPGGTLLLA